jgi:hypothetical protein
MWIRELATGWERVYKPSEHASASVTRGTRDAVPTQPLLVFQQVMSPASFRYGKLPTNGLPLYFISSRQDISFPTGPTFPIDT